MSKPPVRRRVILASASPARRALLIAAGITPEVVVSSVDEDALVDALPPKSRGARTVAALLALAKARDVADQITDETALVIGCDSVLDFDGRSWGKPADAAEARRRWHAMRGRDGVLVTGHAVIDLDTGSLVEGVASTTVHFGRPTDDEVDLYIATGEPLRVAGAFTLDGLSAPFIDSIDGDHTNVLGLSLPLLRGLMLTLGVVWPTLWSIRE